MFGSNAKTAPSVSTLRVQSSVYGVVLPTIRGANRLPAKLIDWTDFIAIASQQSVGGKGFGGGGTTVYSYQAAIDLALTMSPGCARIGLIWDGAGEYGNGQMIEEINIPSGTPGSYTPVGATDLDYSADVGVSIITTEEVWVPAYDPSTGLPQGGGAPGVGDGYYETVNVYTPMARVDGSNPGQGQYSITGSGVSLAYLFNSGDAGKRAKMVYALTVNIANEFEFFSGARPQIPWSYMAGKYPPRALPYAGTCHIAAPAYQLGSSGTLNNLNVEVIGPGVFGGGIQDAGIDACIHLVLDDIDGGCGFPAALIGDLTAAIAYCAAAGIFFSPICDTQQTAASYLQDYCDAANLAACWNDGLLKFIPYGDTPLAGNGFTYVPDLTPVYDLDDDDFIADADAPPVKISREDPETLSNIIEIDILDRALSYNTHPIKDRDGALIFRFGPIAASPRKYDFICDVNVGAIVANQIRLRTTQIDTLSITFKLGPQYELLEKMDIVTITALEAGWTKRPFRLKESDEDPSTGETEWTAEPVMWGSCNATLYPKQAPGGSGTQRDAAPGNILAPVIFEPPDPLIAQGEYELWLGLCGASLANWGGCHIYASSDGNTYKNILPGQYGPSRMGVLTADFPAVAGLDTTSTLAVNLSESAGTMLSGTADDRDSFRTLCWVEGASGQYELISYMTATLTAANQYALTSIQRGVYGTPVLDHPTGSRFLRCDDAVTKLTFAATDVGKTAYIKTTSFNKYGLAEQDLSTVAAYTYTLQGAANNAGVIANDATVDWDPATLTGTGVTIRAYGAVAGVPTPGTAITFKKTDGTTFTCAAMSQAASALTTTYYAMLNRAAGTTYWTTNYSTVLTNVGYGHIMIGYMTTPNSSGAGGTGGGGGGTNGSCFSGNVATEVPDGWVQLRTLPRDVPFEIVNETGTHWAELLVHDFDGEMIDFTGLAHLVTPEHLMKCGEAWEDAARFYSFRKRVHYAGEVFNLHVLSDNPADQHFRLHNGDIAHNLKNLPT